MSLIEIKDLTISTPSGTLVKGVNLTLDKGERLGLIGESGSGKSLTATAAIGLLPPPLVASGSIRLKGVEVIGAADADLVPLRGTVTATVFQEPLTALDPLMTIGKQIARPLWRRANRRGEALGGKELDRRLDELLEQVSLPDPQRIIRSYPHEISGGQRQRVAIAMALACDPELLIADEPTTALDVTTQAEILDLLDCLVRERNMALLFISHDLPVVAGIVNQVMVLEKGLPVETGPVEQVFAHPTHPYTKRLLSAAAHFDNALDTRP